MVAAGNIDLFGIAANHHPAILAKAGQEHLHLLARGVLCFVENDKSICQRATAHKGNRGNLDLA